MIQRFPANDVAVTFGGSWEQRQHGIEPITPPGQVYASEAFAALSAAQRTRDFTCDYVGQTPMAKGYGTLPMYHVRRSSMAATLEAGKMVTQG